jgi:hypothetical protein
MKTYDLPVQIEFQSAARNSQLDDIRIPALVDQLFATTGLNHVAPPCDTPTNIAPGSIAAKTPPESARGEAFHLRFVMVDYYSLISRAVAALETNTFDDRRDIYNRARAVQSFHLRKLPFNKEEFNRERLVLEDAIGRVETEATTKRIVAEASASTPVQPSDIGPPPITPLPPSRSWLKRMLYRLWRD